MRRIHALRTLALSSVLIFALGGTGCAGEEDTVESASAEAAPPDEASEEAADETSSPAEKTNTEDSEAEKE